jgi:Fur family ferric uptake transcriptional regulator
MDTMDGTWRACADAAGPYDRAMSANDPAGAREATPRAAASPAPAHLPAPAAFMPLCSVFRRFLIAKGLKYTAERAAVLDEIIELDRLFEVESLHGRLKARGLRISRATVYRTIRLLQDAGIVTAALFDNKPSHYELIFGRTTRDALVCVRSGRTLEFESPELAELRDRICRAFGWDPLGHRFQIYAVGPLAGKDETREDLGEA